MAGELDLFLAGEYRGPQQHGHLVQETLLGDEYFTNNDIDVSAFLNTGTSDLIDLEASMFLDYGQQQQEQQPPQDSAEPAQTMFHYYDPHLGTYEDPSASTFSDEHTAVKPELASPVDAGTTDGSTRKKRKLKSPPAAAHYYTQATATKAAEKMAASLVGLPASPPLSDKASSSYSSSSSPSPESPPVTSSSNSTNSGSSTSPGSSPGSDTALSPPSELVPTTVLTLPPGVAGNMPPLLLSTGPPPPGTAPSATPAGTVTLTAWPTLITTPLQAAWFPQHTKVAITRLPSTGGTTSPNLNTGAVGLDGAPAIQPVGLRQAASVPMRGQTRGVVPGASKEPKKSAHNVIERRYRNNINEKIAELRSVVPALNAPDLNEKLNKGKILRRATEYIRYVTQVNTNITNENAALREIVRSLNGEHLLEQLPSTEVVMAAPTADDGADSGDDEDGGMDDAPAAQAPPPPPAPAAKKSSQPRSSASRSRSHSSAGHNALAPAVPGRLTVAPAFAPVPVPAVSGQIPGAGMRLSESGRVALLVCMGLCLVTTPWSLFSTTSLESAAGASARSLLGFISSSSDAAWMSPTVTHLVEEALWFLMRVALALLCLVAVFLGDPIISHESTEFSKATSKLEQANEAVTNGLLGRSRQFLEEALTILGRPVHVASLDITMALCWQVVRQVSHVLYVGYWLDRLVANRNSHAREAFGLTAKLVNALQRTQLIATDDPTAGPAHSLIVALSAVNLSEAYGMEPAQMARVYTTMALQMHVLLPERLHFIARYYVWLAKRELAQMPGRSGTGIPEIAQLGWMREPEGIAFFEEGGWMTKIGALPQYATISSHFGGPHDPLNRFAALYREHLLQQAQQGLMDHDLRSILEWRFDVLYGHAVANEDHSMEWWALMGHAALLERLDSTVEAQRVIAQADLLLEQHPTLKDEPLRKIMLLASFARACVRDGASLELSMRAADRATSLIRQVAVQARETSAQDKQQKQQATSAVSEDRASTVAAPLASTSSSPSVPAQMQPNKMSLCSIVLSNAGMQILEVRLAVLVRVKSLGMDECDKHAAKLLRSARGDLASLQAVSQAVPSLLAPLHRLRAVVRSLAGGSSSRTVALFDKALSLARSAGLLHEEGAIYQSMAWCASSSPDQVHRRLQSALTCFEQSESMADFRAVKSLLQVSLFN